MHYSFGNWVRRRRKALDLTQQELAGQVGCSLALIVKIEADQRRPSRQIAELLAQHLEIAADQRVLFLEVARQDKAIDALPATTLPLPALVPDSHHSPLPLPVPTTVLIGRERELEIISRQIEDPACRLLTLTGPGGAGKTRLALEAAHHLKDRFHHGTCFVSLGGVNSTEFIIPAIADSLNFTFSGATELKVQLFQFLKERNIFLVLDNLEHLLTGIEFLDELLGYASRVKLLTTSRESLGLRAEWTLEIQGLPVPSNIRPESIESNSASALFIQRARQVKLDLYPSQEDMQAIVDICQSVAGLPLGLELAATWVRILPLQQIASEITRNIDFLATTKRDVHPRHRSVRAVMEHSWNLLSDEESKALMRLSVFYGGFSRDAVEQIAGTSLHLLFSLAGKSLIRSSISERYELHELIRQFADTKLKEQPEVYGSTHDRHCQYYLSLINKQEASLKSSQQPEALEILIQENNNIQAAWDWALKHHAYDTIGKAIRALYWFYELRDWYHEGVALFERTAQELMNDAGNPQQPSSLGQVLAGQGWFYWRLGEFQSARLVLEQSHDLLGAAEDTAILADATTYLGHICSLMGDFEQGQTLLQKGVDLHQKHGDLWGSAIAASMLGRALLEQGEYSAALKMLEQSMKIGDPRVKTFSLVHYGATLHSLGKLAEARSSLMEAFAISHALEDHFVLGKALLYLGNLILSEGDLDGANTNLQESVDRFKKIGDQWSLAQALISLANSAQRRGDTLMTQSHLQEALGIAKIMRLRPVALDALVALAELEKLADHPDKAYELGVYVFTHRSSSAPVREKATTLLRDLESILTPERQDEARRRAEQRTPETFTV